VFNESTDLYDLIYTGIKDYDAEATAVSELLKRHRPGARDLLDVGCGTGEHARALSALGYTVDGVDVNPEFVRIAQEKNPTGSFICFDMVRMDLDQTYDAVLCLFSSIGYMKTADRMTEALGALGRHVRPGGIILVEPWFKPEEWQVGRVDEVGAADETRHVRRMSYSDRRGSISVLELHYLVGVIGQGVEYRKEIHELGLFTVEEMRTAFSRAGLDAEWDPVGLSGRGMYLGRPGRIRGSATHSASRNTKGC
jgi:SAM-dependent methyltransferase